MIISLYAGGMTARDIQHPLASTIGTDLSHETIRKITDEVLAEVLKVAGPPAGRVASGDVSGRAGGEGRDGAHVKNKAAHIAVSVDIGGHQARVGYLGSRSPKVRSFLGRGWPTEGVKDVLIVRCDGLTGFP